LLDKKKISVVIDEDVFWVISSYLSAPRFVYLVSSSPMFTEFHYNI
jgi:hypothetical protein